MAERVKTKVKGLTELSAKTALRGMRSEDDPTKFWFDLEEHMQRLLFPHLWGQCMEALEVKSRAKLADVNLYIGDGLNYRRHENQGEGDQNATTSGGDCDGIVPVTQDILGNDELSMDFLERIDLKRDPYVLKQHFKSTWRLLPSQDDIQTRRPNDISWAGWDLYCTDLDLSLDVHIAECGDLPYGSTRLSLRDLISSQLLFYRLVAVFGMPSTTDYVDSHGTVWGIVLVHGEGNDGRLAFEDFKGGAHVAFQGSVKASELAVQVVEWLIGDNIPHGSYYRLLGTAD